jgi:hypothetical protein
MRTKDTDVMPSRFDHDALLQEALGNKVRCNTCERHCLIIPGGMGWCQTRENRGGKLVSLIYGNVSSVAANPIEKKLFIIFTLAHLP